MRERLAYAVVPIVALLLAAYEVKLPYYSEGPGPAKDVLPLIHVHGTQRYGTTGHLILTSVSVQHLNLFQYIGAKLDPARDVVPESFFLAPGETEQQETQRSISQMDQSKIDGTAVA